MAWLHPPAIGCRFSFLHLPCSRCGHTVCLYEDSLVLFGGFDGRKWLNDVHLFNTSSMVWTQPRVLGSAPQPRQYHTAQIIGHKMYIFGGYNGSVWLRDLIILDFHEMQWKYPKVKGDLPNGKEGHAMASVDKYIYLFGGWDGSAIGDLHRLDTTTLEWKLIETAGSKPFLCGHTMTNVKGQLFIFGGFDGNNWVNTLYVIDPSSSKPEWVTPEVSGSPVTRGYHCATLVNRYILIYAGYNGSYILGDLVALDTEYFTWTVPASCFGHFPTARHAFTMTLSGSELYIFGGYNGARDTNELHVLETAAFSSLHDDMWIAFEMNSWQDVKLFSTNGNIMVHSVIIRARCPYLYKYILSAYPDFEGLVKQNPVWVDMGSISEKSLTKFCEYLYCDLCADQITPDIRDDLLLLASKYDLARLRKLCIKTMHWNEQTIPDSALAVDMMKCKEFEDLSDLTVVVEGTQFKVHKVIMAARCPYFRAMLNSGMKETSSQEVSFPDLSSKAFELIIDWIYSDKFSPLFSEQPISTELGINLLFAANILDLQSLMRMTEIVLERSINIENVIELYEVAFALSAVKLKCYCVNLILREFDRVSLKREFATMNEAAFNEVSQFLPRRIKRQTSYAVASDLSMIRWEKEEEKFEEEEKEEPVMVSGHLFQNLRIPVKEFVVRPQNPSSPANELPSTNVYNAIIPSDNFRVPFRGRIIKEPEHFSLNIMGTRAGGLQSSEKLSPKFTQKSLSPQSVRKSAKSSSTKHSTMHRFANESSVIKPELMIKGFSTNKNSFIRRPASFVEDSNEGKEKIPNVGLQICSSTRTLGSTDETKYCY
ncbi:unnamed protein product [Blepharisma stoltei]|uniref:BTB domain-containing protein n=1 Tax=Blepharisma stoltei TaxID=1481888 RepID=A0AAU9IVV7_9CILI|nr:unnamed protein product [Blepharisma stoltei]